MHNYGGLDGGLDGTSMARWQRLDGSMPTERRVSLDGSMAGSMAGSMVPRWLDAGALSPP